ncbi:MAG: alpha-amylase [Fusobacteriaceae bacterium]|nr:alpha-amylase [Fusobacteriaceae bacterium]MBP9596646.1 alpha-amylase [Fusobacteriaceae bacterium]
MKKLLLLLSVIVALYSCEKENKEIDLFKQSQKEVLNSEAQKNLIIKANEYIEKSPTETLFLFKAPKGAKIEFCIGEKGKKLDREIVIESYEGNGLTVNDLEVGKSYDYQIKSILGKEKVKSELQNFTKESLKIAKDRPEWAKNAVFYEVFVRSFYDSNKDGIGDIKGLKEKIPYLKELGVTALWLMPINSSPSYHGYDVKDYKNINEDYGSLEDFKEFMKEAKKNNIKVIMDFVLNHSSDQHQWFKEAKKDKSSPYRDYYVWADEFDNVLASGDWSQKVWHGEPKNKYFGIFWEGMPDLNYRNPKLRNEIKNMSKFWLDLGVDGFRLDASKYIDPNNEVTHLWWKDFNSYVKSINKDAFIVGENWDTSADYVGKFMESMDSSFNFNFSELIVDAARGNDVDLIKEVNKRDEIYKKYNENFIDTIFLRNHDMTRLSNELLNDVDKQKLAISILMTLPGTPFVYYGEELGQQGHKPDENLREPMDWYKKSKGIGMTSSPNKSVALEYTVPNDGISLEEEKDNKDSIYEYTRKLIQIRKENPEIINGKYTKLDFGYKINAYEISNPDKKITVVHNSNSKEVEVKIDEKNFTVPKFSSIIVKEGKNLL